MENKTSIYANGNIDDFVVGDSPESYAQKEERASYATKMSNVVPALSKLIGFGYAERVADAIISGKIPHVKYVG